MPPVWADHALYSAVHLLLPILTNGAQLWSNRLTNVHFWGQLLGGIGMGAFMVAEASRYAAESSADLAARVATLQSEWRERAGRPRRDSAAARIISVLPIQPIASAATIRGAIGARHQRALEGRKVLADAGVLRQISAGSYDRQYAADELFGLIEDHEAEVADRSRRPDGEAGTNSS